MNKYNYVGELVMVKNTLYARRTTNIDPVAGTPLLGIVVEQYSRKSVLVLIISEGKYQNHKYRIYNCKCPPFFDLHPLGHKDNNFHVLNEEKANPL